MEAGARPDNKDLRFELSQASDDPDEFFARSLTSPSFQSYLSVYRYRGDTLAARFAPWFSSRLFGLWESGRAPSWLDAALAALLGLTKAMPRDKADYRWAGAHERVRSANARKRQ